MVGILKLAVRGPHGQFECFDPAPRIGQIAKRECDTVRCNHCSYTKFIWSPDVPRAVCKGCMQMVCERCAPRGKCNGVDVLNVDQWLEREEAQGRRRVEF